VQIGLGWILSPLALFESSHTAGAADGLLCCDDSTRCLISDAKLVSFGDGHRKIEARPHTNQYQAYNM
jgi:hypothetical protein